MIRTLGEGYIVVDGKRLFQAPNPPSTPGSRFSYSSGNALQEEICNVIEYAGGEVFDTAEEDTWDQLTTAIFKSNAIKGISVNRSEILTQFDKRGESVSASDAQYAAPGIYYLDFSSAAAVPTNFPSDIGSSWSGVLEVSSVLTGTHVRKQTVTMNDTVNRSWSRLWTGAAYTSWVPLTSSNTRKTSTDVGVDGVAYESAYPEFRSYMYDGSANTGITCPYGTGSVYSHGVLLTHNAQVPVDIILSARYTGLVLFTRYTLSGTEYDCYDLYMVYGHDDLTSGAGLTFIRLAGSGLQGGNAQYSYSSSFATTLSTFKEIQHIRNVSTTGASGANITIPEIPKGRSMEIEFSSLLDAGSQAALTITLSGATFASPYNDTDFNLSTDSCIAAKGTGLSTSSPYILGCKITRAADGSYCITNSHWGIA